MARASKPTIAARAAQAICPNCGGPVVRRSARGPMPTFCDAKGEGVCKKEHFNRHVTEGRAAIAFLKAWRIDRGTGEIASGSLDQICRMVDGFNLADREANRPRADLYAAKILATGTFYFDRCAQD